MLTSKNRKKTHSIIASLYSNQERILQIKADEVEELMAEGDESGARDVAMTTQNAVTEITLAIRAMNNLLAVEE